MSAVSYAADVHNQQAHAEIAMGIAAAISGLGQRFLGDKGAMAVTKTIVVSAALLAGSQTASRMTIASSIHVRIFTS